MTRKRSRMEKILRHELEKSIILLILAPTNIYLQHTIVSIEIKIRRFEFYRSQVAQLRARLNWMK